MTTPDTCSKITPPNPDVWEAAYLRFETPEQEIRKFQDRLNKLGAKTWPRDSQIVELFCGRGNGLHALHGLGFTALEGVDLSPTLIAQYKGDAVCYTGDCRQLPFADRSKDILVVQGGLHHLPELPVDLQRTVLEMQRVLRPSGRLVIVEPWLTPFLSFVHAVCENPLARRMSNKLDALATMIENERVTYEQWLGQPQCILTAVHEHFDTIHQSMGWGKWNFVGTPKRAS
jgi:ubiquinone/menaquinone biosynthesis C-methylase UbiE